MIVKHFGQSAQSLESPSQQALAQEVDKLRGGCNFLAILFNSIRANFKTFVASCKQ